MTAIDATDDWYAEDAATFGDRLAAARETAGLSQAELAERLGVKTNTITSLILQTNKQQQLLLPQRYDIELLRRLLLFRCSLT